MIRTAGLTIGFMALAAVLAAASSSVSLVDEVDLIVLDMPHGGRRIAVRIDGSGTYSYGALPALGQFSPGTFKFHEMYDLLRAKAESNRRDSAEDFGTVQFIRHQGSDHALYFVYDRQLLLTFLDTAFANRVEPQDAVQRDVLKILDHIWSSDAKVH